MNRKLIVALVLVSVFGFVGFTIARDYANLSADQFYAGKVVTTTLVLNGSNVTSVSSALMMTNATATIVITITPQTATFNDTNGVSRTVWTNATATGVITVSPQR